MLCSTQRRRNTENQAHYSLALNAMEYLYGTPFVKKINSNTYQRNSLSWEDDSIEKPGFLFLCCETGLEQPLPHPAGLPDHAGSVAIFKYILYLQIQATDLRCWSDNVI
jgi:hypothetical protein